MIIGVENEIQLKENIEAFKAKPNTEALSDLMEFNYQIDDKMKKINNWKKL